MLLDLARLAALGGAARAAALWKTHVMLL